MNLSRLVLVIFSEFQNHIKSQTPTVAFSTADQMQSGCDKAVRTASYFAHAFEGGLALTKSAISVK